MSSARNASSSGLQASCTCHSSDRYEPDVCVRNGSASAFPDGTVGRSARGDIDVSENLRLLGKYSAAMESGDGEAVFEFFAPEFHSHVTERVTPHRVGDDIRGDEQYWWQQAKNAFPDMTFTVELLIESDDLVVSNWTVRGTHTGAAFYDWSRRASRSTSTAPRSCAIHDGQIVEHWGGPHCQEGLGLIR